MISVAPGQLCEAGKVTYDVLELEGHLLAEGGDDGDDELLAVLEGLLEVLAELVLGDLDVVLGVAVVVHEVEESAAGARQDVRVSFGRKATE
jgi:hypothetical protein